ncbi:MAG: response regulator transcription factor [Phaeodactylibacter sp.]|nr:response regulator transcription factor [Phaeodactylibacter sp.]MCB9292571.1 response regulator transcription factor [Lewinellaceae bacterium]
MIYLGIIEDEPMVRENLEIYFGAQPEIEPILSADSVEGFMENLQPNMPLDTILLDIGLPGMSGLEGIRLLKGRRPDIDVIMLTAYDDSDRIFKALCAGADSYLIKRTGLPVIKDAILTVHRGGSYMSPSIARKVINHFAPKQEKSDNQVLTDRQLQIVNGLVDGLSYKMIADQYLISVETVRDHIKKIYRKLQVNSKAEVIRKKLDGEI